jgi:leucyl aminopeptidase
VSGARHTDAGPADALPVVSVHRGTPDGALGDTGVDAVVLPVAREAGAPAWPGPTSELVSRYGIDIAELGERLGLEGHAAEVHTVQLPRALGGVELPWAGLPARLVLVGVGTGDGRGLRAAGEAVAAATKGLGRVVTTAAAGLDQDRARALVEGFLVGCFGQQHSPELVLMGDHPPATIALARTAAQATWTARGLADAPANTKTPLWLAERASQAAQSQGLSVKVHGLRELRSMGFGALLAVAAGSAAEPRLVEVSYEPRRGNRRRARHVVLVGKGITFDTGGLSVKPGEAMLPMRTDMSGAAVVLAVVLGAAALGVPHRVTALMPLAENALGAGAYRPGDVLRTYGGITVEVVNTDAEGRLVLADALSYADRELRPDVLVDVATLTGAATLGLGRQRGALLTNDDLFANDVRVAGEASGEPVWRFPLVSEYAGTLTSEVADVRHLGDPDAGGGAITAALFLQHFVGKRSWVHLDIAGPARFSPSGREPADVATGFGARLLLRWLEDLRA